MRRSIIVAAATYGLRLGGFFLGRSPRRRVLMVIASAALLGALLGGVFRLAWPETALADPCTSLPYGNDEASDGYHAGMRSSQMTVEDYATTCIEIDSLGLLGPGQASVEIGVSHDGSNVLDCEGTGFKSAPYLFVVDVTQTGGYNCVQPSGQSVTPWAKEGFSLQDQDQDGYYSFAHNGSNFANPFGKIDWSKGTTLTNSERHNAADLSWGHFESNFFMSVTDGWTAWDSSAYCYLNNNDKPNTHFFQQIWSPSNITVATGSQNC